MRSRQYKELRRPRRGVLSPCVPLHAIDAGVDLHDSECMLQDTDFAGIRERSEELAENPYPEEG